MYMSDDERAGNEEARAWLQGNSELFDDLADLVESMAKPLGATARAFLQVVGNAARAAKREGQPTSVVASDPAPPPLSKPVPAEPKVDIDAFRRRQREHERRARFEELARNNADAWREQSAMLEATRRF
jgi:hypothetical protein